MIRGTTPTVTLPFPFAASTIDQIRIYFVQGSDAVLTKDEEDDNVTMSGNNVEVALTQSETYLFSAKKRLRISARFMKTDGSVGGTKPKYFDVYDAGGTDEVLEADET